MGRSPPFGSAPRNSVAHFGLAFATPPGGFPLGSLRSSNSPAHYAKGTQSVVSTRRPTDLLPLVGTRFQVLFHSPSGVLFTFPSRYWFTIGLERVFSLTRWSSRIHAGFLGSRITWETATGEGVAFAYATFTLCGSPFQDDSANDPLCNSRKPLQRPPRSSRDPDVATLAGLHHTGLGCSAFARRYSRNRGCFLFLRVLRCFSSPGWPPPTYEFSRRIPRDEARGLPHSEIPGSKLVCSSPRLIAAYHVLLRLLEPRHSPCALCSLTKILERGFRLGF